MRDIRDQVAAYSELLDQAAPSLEELVEVAPAQPTRTHRFQPRWAVAAGALGVLVIVGGSAVLSRGSNPAAPPTESTTNLPGSTWAPVTFELLNRQAVTAEMFPEWEHAFAGPGAVSVVGGKYHMLSAAYGDGLATVAYAVSDDGVVWSQGSNHPVLDLREAPWAPIELDEATPRSLVVDSGGVWHLFFDISWYDKGIDEFRANIGRATATDPAGPWTYDRAPVLRPDEARSWMSHRVTSPSVVAGGEGFLMVFVGHGEGDGAGVIGQALSSDGSTWQVRPSPIFAASAGWERDSIQLVDLVAAPGGYGMFYTGDTPSRRGLAVSTDALFWVPHPENPLITTLEAPRASIFDSEFVVDGSSVLGLIEGGGVRSEREVIVLRINVDLARAISVLAGR